MAPDWIHELKHDGYRLLAFKRGSVLRLWSSQATDFTEHLVQIAGALRALPVDDVMIDGEAVVLRPDGHSDFHELRSREGGSRAVMIAFDLLAVAGQDVRKQPLEERRERLANLLERHESLLFSQQSGARRKELYVIMGPLHYGQGWGD